MTKSLGSTGPVFCWRGIAATATRRVVYLTLYWYCDHKVVLHEEAIAFSTLTMYTRKFGR